MMHTRMVDLARDAACYREEQDDLAPARGIVHWTLLSLCMWAVVFKVLGVW
jgi:hypothetical protein